MNISYYYDYHYHSPSPAHQSGVCGLQVATEQFMSQNTCMITRRMLPEAKAMNET